MSDDAEQTRPARGRPRASEPRTSVSTWVPAAQHDRLIKLANKHDMSVSALVRTIIEKNLR